MRPFFLGPQNQKQNMNCFAKAFVRLMAHHDDSENLLLISRELDTCLQQNEKRRMALQELDARVDALVQWRLDADASASGPLHLGPTGPVFRGKPSQWWRDADASASGPLHLGPTGPVFRGKPSQWRLEADACASRALHLGPTGPLFHDKLNPRQQDPDANAGMVHH
jgi:hypothetical protein